MLLGFWGNGNSTPQATTGHRAAIMGRDGDFQHGTSQTAFKFDGDQQCGTSRPTTRLDGDCQHTTPWTTTGCNGDLQNGTSRTTRASNGDRHCSDSRHYSHLRLHLHGERDQVLLQQPSLRRHTSASSNI